jgi:hypothetical protein
MIAVSARREIRVALQGSVRRIAVPLISFEVAVRRRMVRIGRALRVFAELLVELLKRFRIFIRRAGRGVDAGVSFQRRIRTRRICSRRTVQLDIR